MTTYETIQSEVKEDGIGILTLNRPEKRNAISIRMRQEISRCLHEWGDSEHVGAMILTGAGSVSMPGFPKPIIAAVNGSSMSGGFDLATHCDLRICSLRLVRASGNQIRRSPSSLPSLVIGVARTSCDRMHRHIPDRSRQQDRGRRP
jgi:enoyl-CoA hydratase/carnithine racemase